MAYSPGTWLRPFGIAAGNLGENKRACEHASISFSPSFFMALTQPSPDSTRRHRHQHYPSYYPRPVRADCFLWGQYPPIPRRQVVVERGVLPPVAHPNAGAHRTCAEGGRAPRVLHWRPGTAGCVRRDSADGPTRLATARSEGSRRKVPSMQHAGHGISINSRD